MKIGPRYKIARRLGAPVFEKTQNQKFVLSDTRKGKRGGRGGAKTDYGAQMLEKQKARYSYLISEKQFSNYVIEANEQKEVKNTQALLQNLELRLDNGVLRTGFAPTRPFARQLVSHGHIHVNGKRVSFPSYRLKIGDKISIRSQSLSKPLFTALDERLKNVTVPSWIKLDYEKKEGVIQGVPKVENTDLLFDLNAVFEFYSR